MFERRRKSFMFRSRTRLGCGERDPLGCNGGYGLASAKNKCVSLPEVFRPRLFKHAQVATRQEHRVIRSDRVPAIAVEIINAVCESEAETGRSMSFLVSSPQLARFSHQFFEWFDIWHDCVAESIRQSA